MGPSGHCTVGAPSSALACGFLPVSTSCGPVREPDSSPFYRLCKVAGGWLRAWILRPWTAGRVSRPPQIWIALRNNKGYSHTYKHPHPHRTHSHAKSGVSRFLASTSTYKGCGLGSLIRLIRFGLLVGVVGLGLGNLVHKMTGFL